MQIGQLTVPERLELAIPSSNNSKSLDNVLVNTTSLSLGSSSSLLNTQLSGGGWLRFRCRRTFSSTITTESLCVRSTTTGSADSQVRSTTSSEAFSSRSIGSTCEATSAAEVAILLRLRVCLELTVPPQRFFLTSALPILSVEIKGAAASRRSFPVLGEGTAAAVCEEKTTEEVDGEEEEEGVVAEETDPAVFISREPTGLDGPSPLPFLLFLRLVVLRLASVGLMVCGGRKREAPKQYVVV